MRFRPKKVAKTIGFTTFLKKKRSGGGRTGGGGTTGLQPQAFFFFFAERTGLQPHSKNALWEPKFFKLQKFYKEKWFSK